MEHNTATDSIPLGDLFSIADLASEYPKVVTVSRLKWQLRSRSTNGLARCCVTQGKRLLISRTRYEQWLGSRAGAA